MKSTWKFVTLMLIVALGSVSCATLHTVVGSNGRLENDYESSAPKVESLEDSKDVVAEGSGFEVEAVEASDVELSQTN